MLIREKGLKNRGLVASLASRVLDVELWMVWANMAGLPGRPRVADSARGHRTRRATAHMMEIRAVRAAERERAGRQSRDPGGESLGQEPGGAFASGGVSHRRAAGL